MLILIILHLFFADSIAPTVYGTNVGLESVFVGGSDVSCQQPDFQKGHKQSGYHKTAKLHNVV